MLLYSYSNFSFTFSKADNVNNTLVDKLVPGLCCEGKALGPSCVNQLLSKRWRSKNMKVARTFVELFIFCLIYLLSFTRTFVKLFIFCRAMCAKRCWQMHKGATDIKLCQICVCSLCHSCNLRKLTKLCQIKRRPRQRNSKLYNLKQFSSRGKPSLAHLRWENITPNLDRKFAIQSYCWENSNRAHAMSTQFWVWHISGYIPYLGVFAEWMYGWRKKIHIDQTIW